MTQERLMELATAMVLQQYEKIGLDVCNVTFSEDEYVGLVRVIVDCDAVIDVADLQSFEIIPSFVCCHFWLTRGYIRIKVSFERDALIRDLVANKELESSIKY